MNSRTLDALETAARSIIGRTRYHRLCPRWLRPLIHVFRLRDINRSSAQIMLALAGEIARQDARIRDLETAAANPNHVFKPRILFDVTCTNLHDHKTGIQRVVRNLARELVRHPAPDTETVLVKIDDSGHLRHADDFAAKLGLPARAEPAPACIIPRPDDTLVIIDGGWLLTDSYEQAARRVNAAGGVTIGVVHDLIPLNMRHLVPASGTANFKQWLDMLLRNCAGLVCVSQTVADDLRRHLAAQPAFADLPVAHFHLGHSPEEFADTPASPSRKPGRVDRLRRAGGTLVLMVGTLETRKAHDHALDAFERLRANGADIVLCIVGTGTWDPPPVVERIRRHPELGKKLFWLNDCDDAELHQLYRAADALLFASLAEGFGLPLLEAAAVGLPIICSDLPVFREICGDHATYHRAGDPASLAETLEHWMRLKSEGRAPSSRDMPRLSWRESAAMLGDTVARLSATARQPAA